MMEPITREEVFMKAAANGEATPEPITRTELFLKKIADNVKGGGGNSAVVIVTMSLETMKLSHTPAEIINLSQAGKIVLCAVTMTGFAYDMDGLSATTAMIVHMGEDVVLISYAFDESGTMSSMNRYKVSVTEM